MKSTCVWVKRSPVASHTAPHPWKTWFWSFNNGNTIFWSVSESKTFKMVLKSPFLNLCSSADGYDKVSNNGAPPVPKTYEFQNGQRVVKKVRLLSPWVLAPRDFQSESLQLRSNLPKNHFFIDIRATTLKK